MKFIQAFFYIIALSFVGIAFGLFLPLLFVLSVLFPSVKKRVISFADRFEDSEEVTPILFTIYTLVDNEKALYENTNKVMIVCEDSDLLTAIEKEHSEVEHEYEFSLMTLVDYNSNLANRNATYSYYYIGTDISIQPPAGVLESFYFHVSNQ